MKQKDDMDFDQNPPLAFSGKKFIVLRLKENGNLFWTSGGEFRSDWYELLFESDDKDETIDYYMKKNYDKK